MGYPRQRSDHECLHYLPELKIPGEISEFNPELDKAGRVADFIELAEIDVIPFCLAIISLAFFPEMPSATLIPVQGVYTHQFT